MIAKNRFRAPAIFVAGMIMTALLMSALLRSGSKLLAYEMYAPTGRIRYAGSFNNPTYGSGSVIIDIDIGSSTVSGYINFTNQPGNSALCGAGNFSGTRNGNQIQFSFVSGDPDPGCTFDDGMNFNVNGTLSGNRIINGSFTVDGSQGGTFSATKTTLYSGHFNNPQYGSGALDLDIVIGASNVAGYIDFTNDAGQTALCGAGSFIGTRSGDSIQFKFISNDSDAGCGFDYGLVFNVSGNLSGSQIDGSYSISNGESGTFSVSDTTPPIVTPTPFPTLVPPSPTPTPKPQECRVPFFSQVDPRWKNHPLRTNGVCSYYCRTIGNCGCTLTSATMLFKYYGADQTSKGKAMNPANLSDCMGVYACPFYWHTGAICTKNKAQYVGKMEFSWSRLDREINQNHRPVIVGMHHKTKGWTHWVVVLSGSGDNAFNYRMHDPAFKGGANMRLSTRSSHWAFDYIAVYKGTPGCKSLVADYADLNPKSLRPDPANFVMNSETRQSEASRFESSESVAAPTSVISGTVWIYRMTELTMTIELTASSKVANPAQMVIWSDTITNSAWQNFSRFVWIPTSDTVYVKYRDELGNETSVYSDTINLIGPPEPIDPDNIFLPIVMRVD